MCVFFDEEEISGYELLVRSGFDFEDENFGYGHAICKIGPDGCDTSQGQDCFCDKSKSWNYLTRNKGDPTWDLSPVGADSRDVRDGDLDGWSWGPNGSPPKPPAMPFSDVCPAAAAATSTPRTVPPSGGKSGGGGDSPPSSAGRSDPDGGSDPAAGRTETARLELEDGISPEPSAGSSPKSTNGERTTAQESTDSDDTEPASYLMFGGFALGFAVLATALYFMRRRRAQSDT